MRKMLMLLLTMALLLMLVPGVLAQTEEAETIILFDLTDTYIVEDLGFQFNYPAGWVTGNEDAIYLAENEADLEALMDDDETVVAAGYTLQLQAIPVDALALGENPALDEVVNLLVEAAEIEVLYAFDMPVMGLRGSSFIGVQDAAYGLATIWLQDGYMVIFSFGLPDAEGEAALTETAGATFGAIIATMEPVVEDEFITADVEALTVAYPDGWFTGTAENGFTYFTETEADLTSFTASSEEPIKLEGLAAAVLPLPLESLGLTADNATPDAVIEALGGLEGERMEFFLFGQPAVGYRSLDDVNDYTTVVVGIHADSAYLFAFGAPADDLPRLEPIMRYMLKFSGFVTE